MSETYEEVTSAHEWRDPVIAWRIFLVLYVAAIALFFLLAAGQTLVWAYNANLFRISADTAALFDNTFAKLNSALPPLYIGCALATVFLTYRTFANAHAAGASNRLTGPLLAATAYFIPFFFLFLPPLMMGKLWGATFGESGPKPGGLIAMWWGTFLLGSFFGVISYTSTAATFEHELRWILVNAISLLLRGIAAACLLITFAAIVKRQRQNRVSR